MHHNNLKFFLIKICNVSDNHIINELKRFSHIYEVVSEDIYEYGAKITDKNKLEFV